MLASLAQGGGGKLSKSPKKNRSYVMKEEDLTQRQKVEGRSKALLACNSNSGGGEILLRENRNATKEHDNINDQKARGAFRSSRKTVHVPN